MTDLLKRFVAGRTKREAGRSKGVTNRGGFSIQRDIERLRSATQLNVHSDNDVMSFTNTRLPEMAGCAQVALSATVYRLNGSNPVRLLRATINSASSFSMKSKSPALTTAVFDASRGWPSHSVLPVLASSPKNCPLDFSDKPNSVSPMSAGLLINSATSLFSHTTSTAHLPSRRTGLSAVTGIL